MEKSDKIFLYVIALSIIAVIASTGYKFLFAENYDFYVEASCDPSTQTCFSRDCSEADACPPNNLDTYRAFYIKADDFDKCEDNSCLRVCTDKTIHCEELLCGELEDDVCIGPENVVEAEMLPVESVMEDGVLPEGEIN